MFESEISVYDLQQALHAKIVAEHSHEELTQHGHGSAIATAARQWDNATAKRQNISPAANGR